GAASPVVDHQASRLGPTVRTADDVYVTLCAGALVVLRDGDAAARAVVGVRLAVAAADGPVVLLAQLRARLADPLALGDFALAAGALAELALSAGDAGGAAAAESHLWQRVPVALAGAQQEDQGDGDRAGGHASGDSTLLVTAPPGCMER